MINSDSSFLVYYSSNIQATHEFWKKIDVEVLEVEKNKIVIKIDKQEIHYVLEDTEPFENYKFATHKQNRGLGVLIYFEVEDLNIFIKKLKNMPNIQKNHWGAEEVLFKDPDGYCFVAYKML